MELLQNCPVCRGGEFKPFLQVKDHFLSKEEFNLQICVECSLVITNPRPDEKSIGQYYKSTDYISHSNRATDLAGVIYKIVRTFAIKHKFRLAHSFIPKLNTVSHLDYGCGTGHFIRYTSQKGWNSIGFEPDINAINQADITIKHLIFNNLKSLVGKKFEIITLFHVLEHVHQLSPVLNQLTSQLLPGGCLILALPNYESFDARHYQSYWAGFDVPRHLYHFNRNSIDYLANRNGLKIEHVAPMKFDSYYVSVLSEKYKHSSLSFLKGMFKGFKSNVKASKTGEYSSLIYILRK